MSAFKRRGSHADFSSEQRQIISHFLPRIRTVSFHFPLYPGYPLRRYLKKKKNKKTRGRSETRREIAQRARARNVRVWRSFSSRDFLFLLPPPHSSPRDSDLLTGERGGRGKGINKLTPGMAGRRESDGRFFRAGYRPFRKESRADDKASGIRALPAIYSDGFTECRMKNLLLGRIVVSRARVPDLLPRRRE